MRAFNLVWSLVGLGGFTSLLAGVVSTRLGLALAPKVLPAS
jgi:hypothetical protein